MTNKYDLNLNHSLQQYKLITGEEIVCQVIEEGFDTPSVIRYPMSISFKPIESVRYYSLNPWMTAVYDKDVLITLEPSSIISRATPSEQLTKEYRKWCTSIYEEENAPLGEYDYDDKESNVIDFLERARLLYGIDSDTMH